MRCAYAPFLYMAVMKQCGEPGCATLTDGGRCRIHQREVYRRVDAKRPNAAKRGYTSKRWRALRARVLARDVWCVAGCGRRAEHADHIFPKKHGGPDTMENLQGLCHACHTSKTRKESKGIIGGGD